MVFPIKKPKYKRLSDDTAYTSIVNKVKIIKKTFIELIIEKEVKKLESRKLRLEILQQKMANPVQ